jgi:hypothetical protein
VAASLSGAGWADAPDPDRAVDGPLHPARSGLNSAAATSVAAATATEPWIRSTGVASSTRPAYCQNCLC